MLLSKKQEENIAKLNDIQSAAGVKASVGIFEFASEEWIAIAGLNEDSDEWAIGDYPVLMAAWEALCRVYATGAEVLDAAELEDLWQSLDDVCGVFGDHGILVERPVEPARLQVAA